MGLPTKMLKIKTLLSENRIERKRLRGPAHLNYAIADSISLLNRELWNKVVEQTGFFMSFDYLKAMEAVLPDNLSPRYALIYEGQGEACKAVAAMYMQMGEINLTQIRPEKAETLLKKSEKALEKLREQVTQRILICGNLLTFGQHGIAFAAGAEPEKAWHGVAEVLYRVHQAEKRVGKTHFLMIKDLHEPFTASSLMLKKLNYRFVETEPNMVLALKADWKSYDDYLASLASKYRVNLRNEILKPIEAAGCTVEHVSDITPYQEQIFSLYKMVHSNAQARPFLLGPEYFSALQNVAGNRLRCTVIKQGEVFLGFIIVLADGDTVIVYHIGYDRSVDLPLYHRLLHAGIADAIAMKGKTISFGRTALEAKAGLGAKPVPFGVLIRHRHSIINSVLKHLLLGIGHDEAPERNPFKKSVSSAS